MVINHYLARVLLYHKPGNNANTRPISSITIRLIKILNPPFDNFHLHEKKKMLVSKLHSSGKNRNSLLIKFPTPCMGLNDNK